MIKRILAILISVALLVWLAHSGDWHGVWLRLSGIPTLTLLAVVAGLVASYLLRAARIHDEFRDVAASRFWAIARITTAHNAAINVLPFRSGEAALPILLQREFGVTMSRALVSLLWLRLQDAFVVLLLAAWVWPGLPLWLRILWSAVVLTATWAIPAWARGHDEASPMAAGLAGRIAKLRIALAQSSRGALRSWGWTLGNWTIKLSAQSLLLASLLASPIPLASAGVLGAELAAILPVQGVAGFGTYEAGVAAALAPHGLAVAASLQAALALHLVIIAVAVIAGAAGLALLPSGAAPQNGKNS